MTRGDTLKYDFVQLHNFNYQKQKQPQNYPTEIVKVSYQHCASVATSRQETFLCFSSPRPSWFFCCRLNQLTLLASWKYTRQNSQNFQDTCSFRGAIGNNGILTLILTVTLTLTLTLTWNHSLPIAPLKAQTSQISMPISYITPLLHSK